jgi:hypothetical protein
VQYYIAEQTHQATPTEGDDKGASSNTGDKQASQIFFDGEDTPLDIVRARSSIEMHGGG